jgi:O-Antigen ligase
MIDAASTQPSPAALRLGMGELRTFAGERLAVGLTAVAIALSPLLVPHGLGNLAPADLFIALALWACLLWVGTSGHRLRFPYAAPVALFMVGGALGALAGPVPGSGIVALLQDFVLLVWCWAVANLCSSPHRLKTLLVTWVYSSICWAVLLFVGLAIGSAVLTGQTTSEGSRTALTFGDPSFSANYYFVSLMIIWATGQPRHRAVRFAAYGILIAALLSAGSNSGIVSLTVGTIAAGLMAVYRRRGLATLATALAFVLVGGYLVSAHVSLTGIQESAHESRYAFIRDGIGRSDVSEAQRGTLLAESVQLYEAGGPLGQGPVSTKTRLDREMAPFVKEAHDDYLAALLERGPLGLIGLVLLVSSLGLMALTIARTTLSKGFGAVLLRTHPLLGAVIGSLVSSTVYELLHLRHLWALFAFIAAVYLWGRESRAPYAP